MNKFYFRLQKVLDIRVDAEEKSKIKFKEAQNEKNKIEFKLDRLAENYDKYKEFENDKTTIEQKIKQQYLCALSRSIDDTNRELAKKEEVLNDRRNDLRQRQIDRKTIEILKEKKETAYMEEQKRIEQKFNDELALYGFIRKTSREGR